MVQRFKQKKALQRSCSYASQGPSPQAEAKWESEGCGCCALLYCPSTLTAHTENLQSPGKRSETHLKPLLNAGEVQDRLQRPWCHTHLIWKTITEGDGDRYTKYWQANANHWSITRLKGSRIRRRLNCLLSSRSGIFNLYTKSRSTRVQHSAHLRNTKNYQD